MISQIGVVGGKIEPEWSVPPPKWINTIPMGYLSLLDLGDTPLNLTGPQQVYGCNFAIRRSLLFEVGGFNPDSFANEKLRWLRGDGETGLLIKVYAKKYVVRYEPSALIYHRIPPNRLTIGYLRSRAVNQGISDEYTTKRADHFQYLHLAANSKRNLISVFRKLWKIIQASFAEEMLSYKLIIIWISYLLNRVEYKFRFNMSSELRKHVYKNNYIEY